MAIEFTSETGVDFRDHNHITIAVVIDRGAAIHNKVRIVSAEIQLVRGDSLTVDAQRDVALETARSLYPNDIAISLHFGDERILAVQRGERCPKKSMVLLNCAAT